MGSNGSKGKKKDFTKLTEVIYYYIYNVFSLIKIIFNKR
jgi:hypothetical protein